MRESKDRGGKWLIEHYGDALLHLAGIRGFDSWRAVQPQVVQQGRTPDGLLEVVFPGEKEPDLFLLEVYTYPSNEIAEDVLRDTSLVNLNRAKIPEVVTLLLHPKGNLQVHGECDKRSRLGLASLHCRWRIIELWTISAESLLGTGEVGLVPWIPFADYKGDPGVLFQKCRDTIKQSAPSNEISNLLAITYIMAHLRYNEADLHVLFGEEGEGPMIDIFEESPPVQEYLAIKNVQRLQRYTLDNLEARFRDVPQEIAEKVRTIKQEDKLLSLHRAAATCASVEEFRELLEK